MILQLILPWRSSRESGLLLLKWHAVTGPKTNLLGCDFCSSGKTVINPKQKTRICTKHMAMIVPNIPSWAMLTDAQHLLMDPPEGILLCFLLSYSTKGELVFLSPFSRMD